MPVVAAERRLACGVEVQRDGGAHVRVWAPSCPAVHLVKASGEPARWRLPPEDGGFHSARISALAAGDRYWFELGEGRRRPDPCSRFQPEGPHGPSEIVDPSTFVWTDAAWPGIEPHGQVLYEMHVGTFTREGTWHSAQSHLPALAELGITVIELMPVACFPGAFGWGYDGVDLYAPWQGYGRPDDFRRFVDRAHALGIGVILDVVYNHLGPDGNYLAEFSPDYFTDKYKNDWGRAINFEGPAAAREYFVGNAAYWIDEFHLDGLRLDATQEVKDASPGHVVAEIAESARQAAPGRGIYVIGENEPQHSQLIRRTRDGGFGLDALWNDDFHHAAVAALTGRRQAYYLDYLGSPQEFVSCAKYGFLYQGQHYSWQKQPRGTPALDLPRSSFISYLENHDQVANSAFGRRLHQLTSPGRHRALTTFLLLGPATPMLFQGQEFNASTPFLYFADQASALNGVIAKGRQKFLAQFPSLQDEEVVASLAPPSATDTYERSRLDHDERHTNPHAWRLHADLIALRRHDPVFNGRETRVDGAVLRDRAFLLRFFGASDAHRLLVINLGVDLDLTPAPEPLLAPPAGSRWRIVWSSESPRYGGQGTPDALASGTWYLPGESAIVLESVPGAGT